MNLHAYQRAVMRVLLDAEPNPDDLLLLGQEARWQTYRHMVRTRIADMAGNAFKQTSGLLGLDDFRAAFALYLGQAPPDSRLIRDVVAAFGEFLQNSEHVARSKPCACDMLRFERARWELAYLKTSVPVLGEQGVRELDFEGALVLNPTLRILTLSYPVHRDETVWSAPATTHLLVYRTIGADEIRWWAATPLFARLIDRAQRNASESLAESVRACTVELDLTLDQSLLESLSDELTLALQRTVIIGVR
jgi:hypothetical protein